VAFFSNIRKQSMAKIKHHSTKAINFTPGKVEFATDICWLLKKHNRRITYTTLAQIVGGAPMGMGPLLGEVNRRHKERGGDEMITDMIVSKTEGIPSHGFEEASEALKLRAN
jgi:hypothetical protein